MWVCVYRCWTSQQKRKCNYAIWNFNYVHIACFSHRHRYNKYVVQVEAYRMLICICPCIIKSFHLIFVDAKHKIENFFSGATFFRINGQQNSSHPVLFLILSFPRCSIWREVILVMFLNFFPQHSLIPCKTNRIRIQCICDVLYSAWIFNWDMCVCVCAG